MKVSPYEKAEQAPVPMEGQPAARCAGYRARKTARRRSPCGSSKLPRADTRPGTAILTSTRCSCSRGRGWC